MSVARRIAKAAARREVPPPRVPDPKGVAPDLAAWIAAQGGSEIIPEVPVHVAGCREGVILAFQARLGDGFPTWVFQRLDAGFLARLNDPFSSLHAEWLKGKPWDTNFDESIRRLERELAGAREVQRVEGVGAILVHQETLAPVRSLLVDKAFVDTLTHGKPLSVAPLIVAGSGGAGIVLVYEREPQRPTLRAERIPAEECERLGLIGADGPPITTLLKRLLVKVRDRLLGDGGAAAR